MTKQRGEQLDIFAEQDPELKERIKRTEFKVGIFGGSSDKQSKDWAKDLAYELTKRWHPVMTGGYAKGVMGAALEGAERAIKEMKKSKEKKFFCYLEPRPTGVIIEQMKPEMAKRGEEITTKVVEDFFARKKELITQPSAFVIFEGGMGTGAEITDAIQYNLKLMKEEKPLIFVGTGNTKYEQLLKLFKQDITEDTTKENVYFASTLEEVLKILEILYQIRDQAQKPEEKEKILDLYRPFKKNN